MSRRPRYHYLHIEYLHHATIIPEKLQGKQKKEIKDKRIPLTDDLQSLRIAPPVSHPSHTNNLTGRHASAITAPYPSKGAPSAPGLPDRLRDNMTLPAPVGPPSTQSSTAKPVSSHPLEARLLAWRATHDTMKMESLRRVYGMAEPIRRGMELRIVRDGSFTPMVLGGPRGNIHEDILVLGGRETDIDWEDVFTGASADIFFPSSCLEDVTSLTEDLSVLYPGDEFREPPSFHDEMEKRLRIDV